METENIWEYKVDNNGIIANFVRCEKPECEDSAHRVGATKMIRFLLLYTEQYSFLSQQMAMWSIAIGLIFWISIRPLIFM